MEAVRKIDSVNISVITDLDQFQDDPCAWLEKQPAPGPEAWLLAYADDGVIWGRVENRQLILAGDKEVFGGDFPPLEFETLQHLYLFGEKAEIHVWKDGMEVHGARLEDGPDVKEHSMEKALVLWGTTIVDGSKQKFTLMEDGAQGLRHAVPMVVRNAQARPLRMVVRQYLDYSQATGEAYIKAVRMVRLTVKTS